MKKRGRPLSEKAIKAKKAAYMKEYYRKKKEYKNIKHEAKKASNFLHSLGDQTVLKFRDYEGKERGSVPTTIPYDPTIKIIYRGWTLEGIGPISDVETMLTRLKGE